MITALLVATLSQGLAAPTAPDPKFGADSAIGYTLGQILGSELTDQTYGSALFRLDSFVQDRTYEGPRLGMSVWGGLTLGPNPALLSTTELGEERLEEITMNQVGILAILRQHAEAPFSGTFGVGFGRLEMTTETEGKTALPAFTIEAGGRYKMSQQSFIDLMVRAHWITRQNPLSQEQEEWWFVELATMVGGHLR